MRQQRKLCLREERVYIGSYIIIAQYYDDDSIDVSLYDELGGFIERLEVSDENDVGFNMN